MSSNIILCETGYYRSACVECQRRKQKCNREWPCDSCRRRKIPDGCRYNDMSMTGDGAGQDFPDDKPVIPKEKRPTRAAGNGKDGNYVFEAMAERAYATIGIDEKSNSEKITAQEDIVKLDSSPQLQKILDMLPDRRTVDSIIHAFLTDVNYHYYIIHPTQFLKSYNLWWDKRAAQRPLSLQYTLLLTMLVAGTLQHVPEHLQESVETEVGESTESYSDKLHNATRELASVLPADHYHILNVQRLLHSCYWYKAEAKFVEAWHVLSQAILEARELGIHMEAPEGSISDYDREINRRLWCILDTWDWQISSGLARPKLIDRQQCTAELPELTLEGYDPPPLLHMKLQSGLVRKLAARFNAPKNIISPEDIQEYKNMIVDWVAQFPPEYDFYDPDSSRDMVHPWIVPHRFYLYTMACILITNPIRTYMVKAYTWESPQEDVEIRNIGVYYSLVLIASLKRWVDIISSRDGRLHFIIFSIFDTAAMLCTAMIKDDAKTLPRREEIITAIADSNVMLTKLMSVSKTAKVSRDILNRLSRKLPQVTPLGLAPTDDRRKRNKLAATAPSARTKRSPNASVSPQALTPSTVNNLPPAPLQNSRADNSMPPKQSLSSGSTPQAHMAGPQNGRIYPGPPQQQPMNSYAPMNPGLQYASQGPPVNMQPISGPPQSTVPAMPAMDMHLQVPNLGQTLLPEAFSSAIEGGVPAVATNWASTTGPPTVGGTVGAPIHGTSIPMVAVGNGFVPMNGGHIPAPPQAPGIMAPHGVYAFPTPIEDPVPDIDLSTLTDLEVGGLAPLWSWHSSNLDGIYLGNEDTPPVHHGA